MGKGRRGIRRAQELTQRGVKFHPRRRDTKHWRNVSEDWERQGRESLEERDNAPSTDED